MEIVITPSHHNGSELNTEERGMGTSQAHMNWQGRNGDQPGCSLGEGQATENRNMEINSEASLLLIC